MFDPIPLSSSAEQNEFGIQVETDSSGTLRRWVLVRHTSVWQPPTDVYELDGTVIVVVEIAGMRDSDFNVMLQGQQLFISGTRERQSRPNCAYHQLEIRFGEFRAEVSLPWPVVRDQVTATYRDGFLRVELPRAAAQKVHVVSADAADTEIQPAEDQDRDK